MIFDFRYALIWIINQLILLIFVLTEEIATESALAG